MADSWGEQPTPEEQLTVRRGDTENAVVFHLAGEIDVTTALALLLELTGVEGEVPGGKALVIDLTEVSFLASAGLALLLDVFQRCTDAGVELRVVAGNRIVMHTLRTSGLTEMLTVLEKLSDAA